LRRLHNGAKYSPGIQSTRDPTAPERLGEPRVRMPTRGAFVGSHGCAGLSPKFSSGRFCISTPVPAVKSQCSTYRGPSQIVTIQAYPRGGESICACFEGPELQTLPAPGTRRLEESTRRQNSRPPPQGGKPALFKGSQTGSLLFFPSDRIKPLSKNQSVSASWRKMGPTANLDLSQIRPADVAGLIKARARTSNPRGFLEISWLE